MKYKPEWAKGEILVKFHNDVSRDVTREFGEGIGYELSYENYREGGCVYLYNKRSARRELIISSKN